MKTASTKSLPVHPAAALFPMMGPEELRELAEDIKAHGLRKAITLFDGQILDGRNRLKACELAGIEPFFEELAYCPSPTEWVVSINLHRRHLTASQRAAIGFEVMPLLEEEAKKRRASTLRQNSAATDPEKVPEREKGESREKAAELVDVNPHYMSDLKKIQAEAPEKIEQIKAGTISIGAAKKELKKSEPVVEEDEPEDSEQLAAVKRIFVRLPKTERALFLRWAKENFS